MKFLSQQNNTPKANSSKSEQLAKDAISLSDGKPVGAFLESALNLLSAQQPVWIPSPQELAEIHQQQAMLSMMAAIRQGEKQGLEQLHLAAQIHEPQQDGMLLALQQAVSVSQSAREIVPIDLSVDKEFINLDSQGMVDGDKRVTVGVASRAIFAKSATAAQKFNISVACFVASIKENELGMVFHCSANGGRPVTVELGHVTDCRLTEAHLKLLTEQFGMQEQQARVLAGTIALQGMAYVEAITSAAVQIIADAYHIDYEGLLRLAINIEKWRVMRTQPLV